MPGVSGSLRSAASLTSLLMVSQVSDVHGRCSPKVPRYGFAGAAPTGNGAAPSRTNVNNLGENGVSIFPGPAFPKVTAPTPPMSEMYCLPAIRYVIGGLRALRQAVLSFRRLLAPL